MTNGKKKFRSLRNSQALQVVHLHNIFKFERNRLVNDETTKARNLTAPYLDLTLSDPEWRLGVKSKYCFNRQCRHWVFYQHLIQTFTVFEIVEVKFCLFLHSSETIAKWLRKVNFFKIGFLASKLHIRRHIHARFGAKTQNCKSHQLLISS